MNIQAALNQDAIDMLPQTKAYINSDAVSASRAGHHNHVIVQKVCNSNTPIAGMNQEQLKEFDENCLAYLKWLDIEH